MRRLLTFVSFAAFIATSICLADDNQSIWKEAADNFDQGKYSAAIEDYGRLLDRGFVSPEVYYNLGNSYFKGGQIGKAIWAYRRALQLNPGFSPAKENLEYVRSFNIDQIVLKKSGFILDIWDFFTSLLSSNGYLVLFASCWWLAGLIAVGQMIRINAARWPQYLLIAVLIIAIFAAVSAGRRIKEDHLTSWGVLTTQTADIREGPGSDFKKLEVGHEGLEFKILSIRENSYLIELGNGLKGWIEKDAVLEI